MNEKLCRVALASRENAYAPYSRFAVGAAVEMEGGAVFGGCNVENASYPQSICAERNAIASAVTAGYHKLLRLYVVAHPLSAPCGGCRSVIAEFSTPDTEVIIADPHGEERLFKFSELMPFSFEVEQRAAVLNHQIESKI